MKTSFIARIGILVPLLASGVASAQIVTPPPATLRSERMPWLPSVGEQTTPITPLPGPTRFTIDVLASPIPGHFPTAGAIAEEAMLAESSVWSAWLANGIRVHARNTPLPVNLARKDAEVIVRFSLIGAALLEDEGTRGLTEAAAAAMNSPWVTNYRMLDNDEELRKRSARVLAGGSQDILWFQIAVPRRFVPWAMQYGHLLLTGGKVRPQEFDTWKRQSWNSAQVRRLSTWTSVLERMQEAIYPPGDVRPRSITLDQMAAITPARVEAWLHGAGASWPLEVAIVGPLWEEAIEEGKTAEAAGPADLRNDIAIFLGSMPARERVGPETLTHVRRVPPPTLPLHIEESMPSTAEKTAVLMAAFGPDEREVRRVQALELASMCLDYRLKSMLPKAGDPDGQPGPPVRNIVVMSTPGTAYPGMGFFAIALLCDEQASTEDALAFAQPPIVDLIKHGPREAELRDHKSRLLNEMRARWQSPQLWAQALGTATYTGLDIATFATLPEMVESVTVDEVRQAFASVWSDPAPIRVTLRRDPEQQVRSLRPLPRQ